MQDRGPAAYVAEFLGTLLLVFFITAVVSLFVVPSTPQQPTPFIDFSVIGLVSFLALFVLFQTFGAISGGHFNPAVTVAMTAIREIKPPDALIYVAAQLAGVVAGALLTKALLLDEGDPVNYGATLVSARFLEGDWVPGMVAEALGTFFLVWAYVGVAVNPRAAKDWAALAIGGALGVGTMVIGPLTGAGFNPARSFGPALVSGEWENLLLAYVLGPVLGALVAALLYHFIFAAREERSARKGLEPIG